MDVNWYVIVFAVAAVLALVCLVWTRFCEHQEEKRWLKKTEECPTCHGDGRIYRNVDKPGGP